MTRGPPPEGQVPTRTHIMGKAPVVPWTRTSPASAGSPGYAWHLLAWELVFYTHVALLTAQLQTFAHCLQRTASPSTPFQWDSKGQEGSCSGKWRGDTWVYVIQETKARGRGCENVWSFASLVPDLTSAIVLVSVPRKSTGFGDGHSWIRIPGSPLL